MFDDLIDRLISSLSISNGPVLSRPHEADVIAHGQDIDLSHGVAAVSRNERQSIITKYDLPKRWHIGLEAAAHTLQTTTQEGMRFVQGRLERRLRTSQAHLRYPSLNVTICTDTLFPSVKSIRMHTCAQLFTDGHCFVRVYPMKRKGDAHHSLVQFIQDVGFPKIILNCAPEEMLGEWGRVMKKYHIKPKMTEPASPWQHRAEAEIREVKKLAHRALRHAMAPAKFWCYALEWAARVRSLTAHDLPFLATRTPEERMSGQTPDISEYAHFEWMEWVWYRKPSQFPEEDLQLGRWLGVAQDVGQAMTYWILTHKGTVVARSSIIPLSLDDALDENLKHQKEAFMVEHSQGERNSSGLQDESIKVFPDLVDDDPAYTTPEADDYSPEAYDEYLNAQVILPVGGELRRGQVLRQKRDHEGRPLGTRNNNPLMDTREYEVCFPDGSTESYLANAIAEGIYSQVDQEGRMFTLLSEIVDHEEDKMVTQGATSRFTTKGWWFLVAWKDGSTSFIPLHEMKNAYPVETADYVVANNLDKLPAFSWWVPTVLRRRECMISKLKKNKTKYWHRSHKYGIELPKSVKEALAIDLKTGTTFWWDAIDKEMKNVSPAFRFVDGDVVPVGYKHIPCHMIFDVKMVGLVRKARFVAGGHLTDPPAESVYSSVVTCESVKIMFLIVALNGLDILGADVQNAYINAATNEKVYTTAGPEFGSREGRPAIIV